MSTAKDTKEFKSFQDRLKQWFQQVNKGKQAFKKVQSFSLKEDIKRELCSEAPVASRIKAIRELCEVVMHYKLEDKAIEKLWIWLKDLLAKEQPEELRHLAFYFLQSLLKGQYEWLSVMRAHFFRVIKEHDHPDDVKRRFELLQVLTDGGKDIRFFEEEIGPFLLKWMPQLSQAGIVDQYLAMLLNIIKFNAAYMDEEAILELVQQMSALCCTTTDRAIVLACLEVLDSIVAYSYLPSHSLPHFIANLCRTVNGEAYCQMSWKVMRNLLGTYMGHSTLYTMCRILQEPSLKANSDLLRGAVFFINMGLWGTHRLNNLRCPPSSVLPSILEAAESNQPAVTYEIVLLIQRLVNQFGLRLHDAEWNSIIDILSVCVRQIESAPTVAPHKLASGHLHETLTTIENFIEVGSFFGSIERFYDIIQECAATRPETSIFRLISYLAQDIIPTKQLWFSSLYDLLLRYYRDEVRTNIRLKALNVLNRVIKLNRNEFEDELIDRIVVPHLIHIGTDTDAIVRTAAAELVIELCMDCESKRCLELLDILERLLFRPFEHYSGDVPANLLDISDIKSAVVGLLKIFVYKIHHLPSSHAVKIYSVLVTFLEQHYTKPRIFEDCNEIRHKIFECFLKIRADSMFHIGYPDANDKLRISPYLCATYRNLDQGPMGSPPPTSPAVTQQLPCVTTYISVRRVFKVIITCLRQEKDWEVLQFVLQGIPQVLQNKSLILSKHGNNEVHLLLDALLSLIVDKSLPETFRSTTKVNRTDFNSAVLMVVACLASYRPYLETIHQQRVIRCLVKHGLVSRCSKQCITALMICTLEMKEVMVKMLPEVILDISKVSATVHIAVALLEFLSTLTKLPEVFSSFVGDQYMSVFAVALPYTNPFRYNHYIVSLAHHVIAVWFLKCRLPFRRDFITYISKGLQTNTLVPFEEQLSIRPDLSKLNEDSSNRKRSSSLTEQSSRRRDRTSAAVIPKPETKPVHFRPYDKTLRTFYEELTETALDLMARYTFSSCSALPRRCPNTEYILNGGQSMTWFVKNKLVTITTSGCTQKVVNDGLCEKCCVTCRLDPNADSKAPKAARSGSSEKEKEDSSSTRVTRQNSGEKSNNNTSASSPIEESKKLSDKLDQLPSKLQQLTTADGSKVPTVKKTCICWCRGWAEIYIRRATGDISWVMRVQNRLTQQLTVYDYPLSEIQNLFIPSLRHADDLESSDTHRSESADTANPDDEFSSTTSMPISIPDSPCKHSPSRQSSRDSIEEDTENIYEDGSKSRNPVRRSNSSPEMSASWKNPFLQKQDKERDDPRVQEEEGIKKTKTYTKDMRVSCEAIPEEISGMGTTPPSSDSVPAIKGTILTAQHPALLSYHSYPGSTPPSEQPTAAAKPAHTVPQSPNILHSVPPLNLPIGQASIVERPNTLASLTNFPPLAAKPPQSPTQTSPRLPRHVQSKEGHEIQKSSSLNLERTHSLKIKEKKDGSNEKLNQDSGKSQIRDRGYTISVMTSSRKPRLENLRNAISSRPMDPSRSGISPSFVFLQLFYNEVFGNKSEKPLVVTSSQVVQRAVKVLDCIPPYETHRIGVIYVGEGQCNNEFEILRNRYGSMRYTQFLRNLGSLIKLDEVDPQVIYLGGLEQDGNDGKFTYIWQEDVIRVTFHVATLMPNKESDVNCTNKKLHIGNNNVTIVYNESGEDYCIHTIKGQFNFACIIVEPLDYGTNKVTIKAKEELTELMGNCDPKIVSDQNVAMLARQLALHADLASLVSRSLKSQCQNPYASNWLERLRKIKNIKEKIVLEKKEDGQLAPEETQQKTQRMDDFSDYA